MSEIGSTDDDISHDVMFVIGQTSRKPNNASRWIANDAGLGVNYTMVTDSGDHLIWSS